MDKEQVIKELTILMVDAVCAGIDFGMAKDNAPEALKRLYDAESYFESKLRELIEETHRDGHACGWAEAQEYL